MMGVGVKVAGLDSPGPGCASVGVMVGLVQRLSGLRNLGRYSSLYLHVLRAIALGFDSWGCVKRAVEAWMGRPVQPRTLSGILNNLVDVSIVGRVGDKYVFLDPMYERASREL